MSHDSTEMYDSTIEISPLELKAASKESMNSIWSLGKGDYLASGPLYGCRGKVSYSCKQKDLPIY